MGFLKTHASLFDLRPTRVAALLLASLLALAPAVARADEPQGEGSQVEAVEREATEATGAPGGESLEPASPEPVAEGDGPAILELDSGSDAPGVVTLRLAEGTRDYDLAQRLVDSSNQLRRGFEESLGELEVDARLQRDALQRAAEISIWLSATRPAGGTTADATELRFHGRDIQPEAVAAALARELVKSEYRSIGVGCWEQQGERFYAILLSQDDAQSKGVVTRGAEPWSPEVQVDLSGATSPVLQGRIQADGYRTNLSMVQGSTRAVRFSWVTAPEEADLGVVAGLPSIAIDPQSFTWTSSDEGVASVSPLGVVAMHETSIFTPTQSREAGADITATLQGTDRALTFHVSAAVPVYRLYNPYTNAHHYTTDPDEYRTLPALGWKPEGVKWQSAWSPAGDGELTATPVHRLLNPTNGDHHYTASAAERDNLVRNGWKYEGVAYYSEDGPWDETLGGQPVYRLYNPYQRAHYGLGSHLWTTDEADYDRLGSAGWNREGASIFGVRP